MSDFETLWKNELETLKQSREKLIKEIDEAREYGATEPDLEPLKFTLIRVEAGINTHIDSLYKPETHDLYMEYNSSKIHGLNEVTVNGIIYNNQNEPLRWDGDTSRGMYEEFGEQASEWIYENRGTINAIETMGVETAVDLLSGNLMNRALRLGTQLSGFQGQVTDDVLGTVFGQIKPGINYEFIDGTLPSSLLDQEGRTFFGDAPSPDSVNRVIESSNSPISENPLSQLFNELHGSDYWLAAESFSDYYQDVGDAYARDLETFKQDIGISRDATSIEVSEVDNGYQSRA